VFTISVNPNSRIKVQGSLLRGVGWADTVRALGQVSSAPGRFLRSRRGAVERFEFCQRCTAKALVLEAARWAIR